MDVYQMFWSYLWGIETINIIIKEWVTIESFDLTYEELKLFDWFSQFAVYVGFDLTYEELKPSFVRIRRNDKVGFDLTYEELKQNKFLKRDWQ